MDFPVRTAPSPRGAGREGSGAAAIPFFDLYGEARPRARLEPVHLEPLVTRSARHGWNIRPHRHRALHQLFWIRRGEGVLLGADPGPAFRAPALLVIPAGKVHGLRFDPASAGHVLTLTDTFVADCGRLTGEPCIPEDVLTLSPGQADPLWEELDAGFTRLDQAFGSFGGGRQAALGGHVLLLLALLRRLLEESSGPAAVSAQAALVRRFRQQVEQRYREHAGLDTYCRELGVTQSTLTRACRSVTGRSPMAMVHERLLAEARRMLIHGSRNVSGVAYSLGFEPAYFSRFFTRHEGVPPAFYQRQHGEDARPRGSWPEAGQGTPSALESGNRPAKVSRRSSHFYS
ncbi:helix-turn-helix domain-containing protein [Roseomonas chloroacetimidivorans]|uniref:helix-turn-helix domain-containing protein n=1 Tax=Roseomonas chloroacetimidivorans TaxID=1766656 RepID=UPI003C73EA1E